MSIKFGSHSIAIILASLNHFLVAFVVWIEQGWSSGGKISKPARPEPENNGFRTMSGRDCSAPLSGRLGQVRDVLDYSIDPIDLAAADRDGREGHLSRLNPVSSNFGTKPHDKTCIGAFSRLARHIRPSRYNASVGWQLRRLTGRLTGRAIAIGRDWDRDQSTAPERSTSIETRSFLVKETFEQIGLEKAAKRCFGRVERACIGTSSRSCSSAVTARYNSTLDRF
jgi:hypothetical protein